MTRNLQMSFSTKSLNKITYYLTINKNPDLLHWKNAFNGVKFKIKKISTPVYFFIE